MIRVTNLWRTRVNARCILRCTSNTTAPSTIETEIISDLPNKKEKLKGHLRPIEAVEYLDKNVIGQAAAKQAVALALRTRWRRLQLPKELRKEVIPKNILMTGPTGCGKTEIVRRVAQLSESPYIKVEATKYTEVGFRGKDVESIIADLLDNAIKITKDKIIKEAKRDLEENITEKLLDALVGKDSSPSNRLRFKDMLMKGEMDNRKVIIEMPPKPQGPDFNIIAIIQEQMTGQSPNNSENKKEVTVKEAKSIFEKIEIENIATEQKVIAESIKACEESGIVFIDEIDKIAHSSTKSMRAGGPSNDGVQRDLLPIVEGCIVETKKGKVNTEHILFICSGAFSNCKPSDLLPELQGRLPIRVTLKPLEEDDFRRILTETESNLPKQQIELLKTEGIQLVFTDDAILSMAKYAAKGNQEIENIGARRLHGIVEHCMEEISYDAPDLEEGTVVYVDKDLVEERMGEGKAKVKSKDYSRYVL